MVLSWTVLSIAGDYRGLKKKIWEKRAQKKTLFWREKKKIKMEKNGDWGLSGDWGIGGIYRSMSTTIPNPQSPL